MPPASTSATGSGETRSRGTPRYGADVDCLIDETRDNYMVTFTGWHENKRERMDYFFVRIRDGKIWM